MRKSCLSCARKHLGQAEVLMMEARQGYPEHKWLAVGHLAEASDELVASYPQLANEIREARLLYAEKDREIDIVRLLQNITKVDK